MDGVMDGYEIYAYFTGVAVGFSLGYVAAFVLRKLP